MSTPRYVQFNSGEQLVSSDLNNLQGFIDQELSDSLANILALAGGTGGLSGPGAALGSLPQNGGVLSGFNPTLSGSSTVTFSGGTAFRINSSPPALGTGEAGAQSEWRWIKSTQATQVSLASYLGGPAQYVLIEITDNQTLQTTQSRNVWVVGSQSVQAQALVKEVDPGYTIQVKATNAPSIPTVDPGFIPLLLVFVPLGASSISSNFVFDIRGMLSASGPKNGILSGLALQSCTHAGTLTVPAGMAVVRDTNAAAGNPANPPVQISLPADLTYPVPTTGGYGAGNGYVVSGGTLGPNQPYYAYLVPNTPSQPSAPISDATYQPGLGSPGAILALSNVKPNSDGTPSSSFTIRHPFGFAGGTFTVTQAIFIGSVCTMGSGSPITIPFTRSGNEVVFYRFNVGGGINGTGGNTFYPGAAYGELVWQTGVGSYPQTQSISFNGSPNPPSGPLIGGMLTPPASASAMIIDAFLLPGGAPSGSVMPVVVFSGTNNENAGQLSGGKNSGGTGAVQLIFNTNQLVTSATPIGPFTIPDAGTYRFSMVCATQAYTGSTGNFPQISALTYPSSLGANTTTTLSLVENPPSSPGLVSPPIYPALLRVGVDSGGNAVDVFSFTFQANASGTFSLIVSPQNPGHNFYVTAVIERFTFAPSSVEVASGRFKVPLLNGGNTISATMLQDPGSGSSPQYLDVTFSGYVEDPANLTA